MKIKFEQKYPTEQNIHILKYKNFQMEVFSTLVSRNKQKTVQGIYFEFFKIDNENPSNYYIGNNIIIEFQNNMYTILQPNTIKELKLDNFVFKFPKEDLKEILKLIIEALFTHNYHKYNKFYYNNQP